MMKTIFTTLAIVLVSLGITSTAAAQLQSKPGRSLGDNPNPVIWGAPPAKPAPQPPPPKKQDPPQRNRQQCGNSRFHNNNYYPNINYTYYNDPGYIYSYAYPPAYYYASADNLYGPAAIQRFMGADNPAPPAPDAKVPEAPMPKNAVERGSNAQANALAGRFIGFGDAQFARQNFVEANSRYRTAARTAPQLADAWFRQGFALSAMGRYKQAVDVVQRGLRIDPDWANSDFTLQKLFGADALAKEVVLDTLVEAAKEKPHDADLLFMLGVYLHFDGQTQQAEPYFTRAMKLAGDDGEHIRAFLAKKP
jgi:tetratricopeptide (TPR) repeat protein